MAFYPSSGKRNPERTQQMVAMSRTGLTLQQIGDRFFLTRERVRQILKAQGINVEERGVKVRTRTKRATAATALASKRETRCMRSYGCSISQYRAIRGSIPSSHNTSPIKLYRYQRQSSYQRGIEFRLTLAEWHAIWVQSGHFHERGRGHGKYVMSRIGDRGAYEVGNVFIQLADDNNREYQMRRLRQLKAA